MNCGDVDIYGDVPGPPSPRGVLLEWVALVLGVILGAILVSP